MNCCQSFLTLHSNNYIIATFAIVLHVHDTLNVPLLIQIDIIKNYNLSPQMNDFHPGLFHTNSLLSVV